MGDLRTFLGELPRIPLPRTTVNMASGKARFFGGLGGDLLGRRDHAQLAHHAQVVSHLPVFDGLAVPESNEVHAVLLHRASGREHPDQGSHRLGAAIPSWMRLVIDAFGIYHLVRDGEVPSIQSLLVEAAKLRLVLFCRRHTHGSSPSALFFSLLY